ncbi:MAG TPA: hypothetical protein VL485_31535 [Ktedonobacteraceae bacterium]|jgi:hypothetical protein|nr:hypothetical protein [Ktedonobacteraceae bacterium]
MNKHHGKGFTWQTFGAIVFSFGLAIMLAACGQGADGPGSPNGNNAPTAQPAPSSTTVNGSNVASGCPSNVVMTNIPTKANVTIQESMAKDNIVAHMGDIVEVRLPFGQKWSGPTASQGVLQIQDPAGYALQSDHVCIWRFQAKGSGLTPLNFTGRAICTPGKMCPLYVQSISFNVNVQ